MEKKKYSYLQQLIASFAGRNVEWYYATEVERMTMWFNSLSETDKKIFYQ